MVDNDTISRESKLLEHERSQKDFILDVKKRKLAEEVKDSFGYEIKKHLEKQNKKPKFAFWSKLKIALFGRYD